MLAWLTYTINAWVLWGNMARNVPSLPYPNLQRKDLQHISDLSIFLLVFAGHLLFTTWYIWSTSWLVVHVYWLNYVELVLGILLEHIDTPTYIIHDWFFVPNQFLHQRIYCYVHHPIPKQPPTTFDQTFSQSQALAFFEWPTEVKTELASLGSTTNINKKHVWSLKPKMNGFCADSLILSVSRCYVFIVLFLSYFMRAITNCHNKGGVGVVSFLVFWVWQSSLLNSRIKWSLHEEMFTLLFLVDKSYRFLICCEGDWRNVKHMSSSNGDKSWFTKPFTSTFCKTYIYIFNYIIYIHRMMYINIYLLNSPGILPLG